MGEDLARFLRGSEVDVSAIVAMLSIPAYLSAWDAVTGANTVIVTGTTSFTNLAIVGDPAALAVGRVMLLRTGGAPVILGRLRKPPY